MTEETIIYQTNDWNQAKDVAVGSQAFTGRQTDVENSGGIWLVKEKRD